MRFAKKLIPEFGNKGVSLILFLLLVPLFMSIFLGLTTIAQNIQNESLLEKTCYGGITQSLKRTQKNIQRLLALNPRALRLRQEFLRLKKLWLAAVASGQEALAAHYEMKLAENHLLRLKLNQLQKNVIGMSNENIQRDFLELQRKLAQDRSQLIRQSQGYSQLFIEFHNWKAPHLAVKPQYPDLAPPYELEVNFEEEQKWSVFWKTTNRKIYREEKDRECAATLRPGPKGNFDIVRKVKF